MSVSRRLATSTTTRVRTVPYAPSADRGTHPVVPFGSAGSRTLTHRCRRASGSTMFVVASGVSARSVPTARAERDGRARATTSDAHRRPRRLAAMPGERDERADLERGLGRRREPRGAARRRSARASGARGDEEPRGTSAATASTAAATKQPSGDRERSASGGRRALTPAQASRGRPPARLARPCR